MTEEKKATVTFTVVAFRYDSRTSIGYATKKTPQEVANYVRHVLQDYEADIISIRRVYQKCPQPQTQTL